MKQEPTGEIYEKMYQIIAAIPFGKVATYSQIASLAGKPRNARQVGYAMKHVSKERKLPCHRVVNQRGELSPDHVFGEQDFQRMLLEMEEVPFLPDGRIDIKHCRWDERDVQL